MKKLESNSAAVPESSSSQQTPQQVEVPAISWPRDSAETSGRCPIATLPSELLTEILSYILANSQKPITLSSRTGRRWKNEIHNLVTRDWVNSISVGPRGVVAPKAIKSPLLDILSVSRSFYFAGIAAFFGENTLKFASVHHLDRLTATLDLDRRRCIRHIIFTSSDFQGGLLADRNGIGPIGER